MPKRLTGLLQLGMVSVVGCVLGVSVVFSQSSNGTYLLLQEGMTSGGGSIGGGNPMRILTTIGAPMGGAMSNGIFTIRDGGGGTSTDVAGISKVVTVTGTINDSNANVILVVTWTPLNRMESFPATVASGQWTANNVRLGLGENHLTATATDQAGNSQSASITVYVDTPTALKQTVMRVDVVGSINDPAAQVTVNGVPATITTGQATARRVPLTTGTNVLEAVSTDQAGNSATRQITVFVYAAPVPRPTVGTCGSPVPPVTTLGSVTLCGTTVPGTTIWINGAQQVIPDAQGQWTVTLTLTEGDNDFSIVARSASGGESTESRVTVILDNQNPVLVSHNIPAKTNLNPLTITGTVDDSLTSVSVNGVTASRTQRAFTVAVPLVQGSNTLTVTMTSPNNRTASQLFNVVRGTIPALANPQPPDGTLLYVGATSSIQATVTDPEGDQFFVRLLIDGMPLGDWGPSLPSWTPSISQLGLHTLTVSARDNFGGSNEKAQEVFVVRPPVQHP